MTFDADRLDRQLVALGRDDSMPSDALRARVLDASLAALESASGPAGVGSGSASPEAAGERGATRWPAAFPLRSVRWGAAAAALALILWGGHALWPGRSDSEGGQEAWWLGSPSAWAGEIAPMLAELAAKGVTCRERVVIVEADGSRHGTGTVTTFYVSEDAYRRDIHEGDVLREIQWYVPDGEGMLQTSVRFDTGTYSVERHEGSFGREDPIARLRRVVELLDKADRLLGTSQIDGHACVGFEIHADMYGDNPAGWIDRIWFDVRTRLPVRVEQSGRPITGDDSRTLSTICEQYDYAPGLSAETFTPRIPTGFVNAHPDELGDAGTDAIDRHP